MGKAKGDVWPGMAERLEDRLRELGFVKDGRTDWLAFVRKSQLPQNSVYRWKAGLGITREWAEQLAEALGVGWGWLLFGPPLAKTPTNGHTNGKPRASSGGALAPAAPPSRVTTLRSRRYPGTPRSRHYASGLLHNEAGLLLIRRALTIASRRKAA